MIEIILNPANTNFVEYVRKLTVLNSWSLLLARCSWYMTVSGQTTGDHSKIHLTSASFGNSTFKPSGIKTASIKKSIQPTNRTSDLKGLTLDLRRWSLQSIESKHIWKRPLPSTVESTNSERILRVLLESRNFTEGIASTVYDLEPTKKYHRTLILL